MGVSVGVELSGRHKTWLGKEYKSEAEASTCSDGLTGAAAVRDMQDEGHLVTRGCAVDQGPRIPHRQEINDAILSLCRQQRGALTAGPPGTAAEEGDGPQHLYNGGQGGRVVERRLAGSSR